MGLGLARSTFGTNYVRVSPRPLSLPALFKRRIPKIKEKKIVFNFSTRRWRTRRYTPRVLRALVNGRAAAIFLTTLFSSVSSPGAAGPPGTSRQGAPGRTRGDTMMAQSRMTGRKAPIPATVPPYRPSMQYSRGGVASCFYGWRRDRRLVPADRNTSLQHRQITRKVHRKKSGALRHRIQKEVRTRVVMRAGRATNARVSGKCHCA